MNEDSIQPDEIYDWAINALESGTSIETIRREIEAANRSVEGMKQRPIFSGKYPETKPAL